MPISGKPEIGCRTPPIVAEHWMVGFASLNPPYELAQMLT